MFSKKSKIYKEIEKGIALELHKEAIKNIRLNTKFRIICIFSIIVSIITPWYWKNEEWSNIYLYMICTDYFLTNCKNFIELHQNCTLASSTCEEIQKSMQAGAIVLGFFIISIILHLISIICIKPIILGTGSWKHSIVVYLAFLFYVFGFVLWVIISGFRVGENTAMYGLTATFISTFIGLFVTVHFLTFSKMVLEHYSVESSEIKFEVEYVD